MAEKLDPKQVATFEELLMTVLYEQEALRRALVRKGVLTNEDVLKEETVCKAEFSDEAFDRDALYYVRAIEVATPTINGAQLRTQFDDRGGPPYRRCPGWCVRRPGRISPNRPRGAREWG